VADSQIAARNQGEQIGFREYRGTQSQPGSDRRQRGARGPSHFSSSVSPAGRNGHTHPNLPTRATSCSKMRPGQQKEARKPTSREKPLARALVQDTLKIAMKSLLVAVTALLLAACSKPAPPEPIEEHPVHGVVLRLDAETHTATVKHDEIKDFMAAMTMDYDVPDKEQFAILRAGQWFDATVMSQDGRFWLDRIKPAKP
jgi:Cu/Ag efflux protein CusF